MISNLAIQRRRINELKKLGYKAEPWEYYNYEKFWFSIPEVNARHYEVLNNMGFRIDEMYAAKDGITLMVTKYAEEKTKPYIKKQVAEILK